METRSVMWSYYDTNINGSFLYHWNSLGFKQSRSPIKGHLTFKEDNMTSTTLQIPIIIRS